MDLIEKGADYSKLKKSFVIFICTFDLFGKNGYIYTFENRCVEYPDLRLGQLLLITCGTEDLFAIEDEDLLKLIDNDIFE